MRDEKNAMISIPNDEVPAGPVPEATKQHGEHEVPIRHECAFTVTSERDVQVVPQPFRERHVPPPPKVGYARSQIRTHEVKRKLNAEQLGASSRYVRITRKIEE